MSNDRSQGGPSPAVRTVVMLTQDRQIDRRILLEADSLEAAGWRVTIIAMALDSASPESDPRVVRLDASASPQRGQNALLLILQWLRRRISLTGRISEFARQFAWKYVFDQETFYTQLFTATVARYSPDVFVAHDLPMLPVAQQAAARCGAKLVYDSHELFTEQELSVWEKRRWTQIERKYIRSCAAVVTVNSSIAAELAQRYDLPKVHVIYNAERTSRAPRRTDRLHVAFGLAPERKILLLQGGLSGGRHLDVLVEAMRFVQNPLVDLVFVGDGPIKKQLQTKAERASLLQRVYFHAAVPQAELLELTESADAGVIPYQATCLNNFYCTPNKLFEFIAAGIPVLGSDLPEISAMVRRHEIGLTADLSTPEEMGSQIDLLFSDEARLKRWQANVQVAREKISWEIEGPKVKQIYSHL